MPDGVTESSPSTPSVTVAVCSRNRAKTLGDCLESLLAQDLPPNAYEVIVVDDGSTDGTAEIAAHYATNALPSVRYVHQTHAGLSASRNRAVIEARGSLICFVDDDAVAVREWLTALVTAADANPDIECFAGRLLLRFEAKPPRTCGAEPLGAQLDLGPVATLAERAIGANMAMRRSAFERIGLFNPALTWRWDEQDWTNRLYAAGGSVLYVPEALVWHRRLASDLRFRNLLKARFGWGICVVDYKREAGLPFGRRSQLEGFGKMLVHAGRARCTGGLLLAAEHLGALWAAVRGRYHAPRHAPPALTSQKTR